MFRLRASRIGIEDIDIGGHGDPMAAISAFPAPNGVTQTTVVTPQTVVVEDQTSTSATPNPASVPAVDLGPINTDMAAASVLNNLPPPCQLPFDHLPYGPEREAIVHQNHHILHLEHVNRQLNAQSAAVHSILAQLGASHKHTVDRLTAEIQFKQLQIQIHRWREQVIISHANQGNEPNQAIDLLEKFADLRAAPISALAEVRPAESASEPGVENGLEPPIATILGSQSIWIPDGEGGDDKNDNDEDAAPGSGHLYGAEEDVALVLAGEVGGGGGGGGEGGEEEEEKESDAVEGPARCITASVMPGAEDAAGETDRALGDVGRAAATAHHAEHFREGEKHEHEAGHGPARADAHRSPLTKPRHRHRHRLLLPLLVGKLKKIL